MKKNGFTLVELLAILIILSLIAIITIPVVFNMIDSSKKGTVKDSAYGYISSIQKMYYSNQLDDSFFEFEDRGYTVSELKSLGISFDGQEPIGKSWVLFSNNDIVKACLQFDDYRVDIKGDEVTKVFKGECKTIGFDGVYVAPADTDTHKGIVYLDPTDLSNTCDEILSLQNVDGKTGKSFGIKTGCMKFYVFKEYEKNGKKYFDMILDHNTSGSAWTLYKQNNNFVNYDGPREALYQLYLDTKDWNGIADLESDSNYTSSLLFNNHSPYTIYYTNHLSDELEKVNGAHKARLITAEEIANITGMNTEDNPNNWTVSSSRFYFGTLIDSIPQTDEEKLRQEKYSWLIQNLYTCDTMGCSYNSMVLASGNLGYWTSSPVANNNYYSWFINFNGSLDFNGVNISDYGIRPVITIPKYVLGID